ncbi:MAG: hypothetical protein M9924_17545 [Rhizobiaceae bacterium]|nr:hypothetical protein [Rhizobiaceae bacterium]
MRFLSLLLLLAGVALAGIYPWYQNNFSGRDLGSITVFEQSTGFRPVTVRLAPEDDPVRVMVDLASRGPANFSGNIAVLTLTASVGGRNVLTDRMSFSRSVQREQSPQSTETIFRDQAGLITPVENADYTFNVGQGDAGGVNFSKVDLILRANAGGVEPRAQPAGFVLVGLGIAGLILSRRRKDRNPNEQPPAPRWGRGGSA